MSTISDVVSKFVDFYAETQSRAGNADAIIRINSGECGNAAIAIGQVLEQKFNYNVQYHDSTNHAYIVVDGIAYDAANPEGTDPKDLAELYSGEHVAALPASVVFAAYNSSDTLGAFIIKGFVAIYGLKAEPFVEQIITDTSPEDLDNDWINPIKEKINQYVTKSLS